MKKFWKILNINMLLMPAVKPYAEMDKSFLPSTVSWHSIALICQIESKLPIWVVLFRHTYQILYVVFSANVLVIGKNCLGSVTCARCAEVGYNNTNCERTERCINCKGDHPAYSISCPKWILEKEIQAVKATKNISYIEARQEVESRTPSIGIS